MSDTHGRHPPPDAVPARPWGPGDGRRPVVWTWPATDPPALWVWSDGRPRRATVLAKQVWESGATYYQVAVDLHGDTTTRIMLYQWPQPGLQVAHRSQFEPSAGEREEHRGDMPRRDF
ncbi:hypothetical protein HCJ76_44015 [Streptomyces sp. MC1]|uniref:hypothetical protein n=1 Tax=Streptomyces sp. MC1 TaxID=295105 RepID=UPI0018CB9059|nr:hypothetical protein [Streptomyces sp. MC1]MBG7704850.1 hypothetical protein [Streptomyces sp. MC1]